MAQALELVNEKRPAALDPKVVEQVLLGGDLSKLSAEQRLAYYQRTCESLGLNPLTKPFDYLSLNGKTVLYARKDCTEQLRKIHSISVTIKYREVTEGCYVVTANARMVGGREDESIGAVPIDGLKGESRSNAMMKCETKAKRRVTLSICGLGVLDETEVESIPSTRLPVVEEAAVTLLVYPDGYEDWQLDMSAAADEGYPAFQAAWANSKDIHRVFSSKHDQAWGKSMKAKAQAATETQKANAARDLEP